MENVLVVDNHNAGRKKSALYRKSVIRFLFNNNVKFKNIPIEDLGLININDFDSIIAIGGDGTVNKLVPYLINTDKTLAIIPCGTANLLAAKLGVPTNIKKALKIIKNGNTTYIDTLKISDKDSILRIGLGYDADIISKTPQSLKNKFGYFAYFIAGIIFALRLKQKKYNISFDDKKLSVVATCIIVANAGNMYKNLFSISKNCKLNDGVMDVFVLKVKNPILFFIEFLQIIFNKKNSNSKAMYFQTSNLTIKNDFTNGHIDGEKTKFKDDIIINVVPKSIKVFKA